MTQPAPGQNVNNEDELFSRADPTFKRVTQQVAEEVGLRIIGAELPQALTADLILEIPANAKLEDTLFGFLHEYEYVVLDFKGQSDTLDISKFLINLARTALFCTKHPRTAPDKVLNLLVCARYPQELINQSRGSLVNSADKIWLWRGSFFFKKTLLWFAGICL